MRWMAAMLVLVAGCSAQPVQPGETIACALDGDAMRDDCRVEQTDGGIILHRADGGFRKLDLVDGKWVAADGAESLQQTPAGDALELVIGGDRYVVPAGMLGR